MAQRARRLDLCNTDELVSLGVAVEESLAALAGVNDDVADLLRSALQGLQDLFNRAARDPRATRSAVADALAAAGRLLDPDTGAEAATQEAGQGRPGVGDTLPSHPPCPETAPDPDALHEMPTTDAAMTVDDVALLFVQLDPQDPDALTRFCCALGCLAEQHSRCDASGPLLQQAAARAATVAAGTCDNPDEELAAIGDLLEQAAACRLASDTTSDAPPAPLSPTDADPEMPEVVDTELCVDFISETRENIAAAESCLLALEVTPDDPEAVNTVFRAFHTIKGTAAFLNLGLISELAHRAETLLSRAREGTITLTGGYADLALRSVDMLKALIQSLQDMLGGEPFRPPDGLEDLMAVLAAPEAHGVTGEPETAQAVDLRLGDILVAGGRADRESVELAAASQGTQPIGEAIVRSGVATTSDVAQALRTQRRMGRTGDGADNSIRIRTERLDRLIETVGELVIAHSMIAQDPQVNGDRHFELARKVGRAGKIVRELQDLAMSMRMVPLRGTFQKMARIARDVAHKSGKSVNFVTEGEDTEIDRNMVDLICDPLVHMVRNAVDHGLEPPAVREQAGKPPRGTVLLSACHAGGNVVVELRDDGRGLDRDRILDKAIARGLVEPDRTMSDSQIYSLIFEPGFSTAEQVTEVSGRGVGLDVVRRNVEALRGRVDITSTPGQGTSFVIRLPLTLAVTDGMLVRVGSERYIVPTLSIDVTFQPDPSALSTVAGSGEMVRVRDDLLPLYRLQRLFGVHGAVEDPARALVLVVSEGAQRYALLVDELLGQQQVVAKPLGDGLGRIPGVSGGAILGDGRVGLILDLQALSELARQAA